MDHRISVNVLTVLVTCGFLLVAMQFSDAGFANSITRITNNLDMALLDLDDTVNYRNYSYDHDTYLSNTSFRPKGMAGLYNLTTMFVDLVVPKDILMDGLITIGNRNSHPVLNEIDYMAVLKMYWGILLVSLLLVLIVLLFPFCGLCFCCCRCCGNCGALSQPADKKRDLCKKIIQATLLIALCTGLLFCVVCAFASNQQMQEGIEKFAGQAKNSVQDTTTYIASVKSQVSFLLVDNFDDFNKVFNDTLDKSSATVMTQLETYSNATSMMSIATFVTYTLPKVNTTLYTLKDDTNQLRVYASQLNDAVRKVRKDLTNTLNTCTIQSTVPMCGQIMLNITRLQTSIDFNKLPDLSEDIIQYEKLPLGDIQNAATRGTQKLEEIRQRINETLDSALGNAKDTVYSAKTTIGTNLDNVTSILKQINEQIEQNTYPYIDKAGGYIKDYSQYRYYVGLGVSCVLLLITICIILGLICGICGKRPDGYTDNCCNKGAGSQFLICSVMIMFTFGAIIALIALVTFILGIVSERGICHPLRHPDQSNIMDLIDEYVYIDPDTKVSDVLINCYQNKSAYETFNLQSRFNIKEIQAKFQIDEYLNKLDLDQVIDNNFVLLSEDDIESLRQLKTFDISNNLDKFSDELKDNFTNFSLDELSTELHQLIDNITIRNEPELGDIVTELQLSLLHLNTYNEKLLKPMKLKAESAMNAAIEIDTELKMNQSSFSDAIEILISEIHEAQIKLNTTGNNELKRIAEGFKDTVRNIVNSYIYRVGNHSQYEIGKCEPLSNAVNAMLVTTCEKVLLPWNGFWFSLLCSLILFLPTIVIAVKLATLYQKYKNYGPYIETEYLYDAYADRGDSIPLNSRGGKRNKKKTKKSKKHDERPSNPNGEVVAREYASGSHPPDNRYADIAPKHWEEFPNGGPPQYQRAPTEYERPPPYYYPGSGGEQ